jgi:hypothetical protein
VSDASRSGSHELHRGTVESRETAPAPGRWCRLGPWRPDQRRSDEPADHAIGRSRGGLTTGSSPVAALPAGQLGRSPTSQVTISGWSTSACWLGLGWLWRCVRRCGRFPSGWSGRGRRGGVVGPVLDDGGCPVGPVGDHGVEVGQEAAAELVQGGSLGEGALAGEVGPVHGQVLLVSSWTQAWMAARTTGRSSCWRCRRSDPSGSVGSRLDRQRSQREQAGSVWSHPVRRRASASSSEGRRSTPTPGSTNQQLSAHLAGRSYVGSKRGLASKSR